MDVQRARRVRREILRLAQSGLDSTALATKAERLLRTVIPFDHACWHNVDPAMSMLTSVIGESAPASALLPVLEYSTRDINQYADVARGPVAAAGLHAATRGAPASSQRYREALQPMQLADELTAAFVVDAAFWGCARLYRSPRRPPFDAVEIAFVAGLSTALAQGFRAALVRTSDHVLDVPDGPGLIVLHGDGTIASISRNAERWLGEIIDPTSGGSLLPGPLAAVAGRARAIAADDRRDEGRVPVRIARCRVPTRSGRWLVFYGEILQIEGEERISIIVEPAAAAEIAPLIVSAYGLTAREQQVTSLLLRGLANKEIATALGLSTYTVSDHVRLIFEKVGVRSRTELSARIFFEHCYPRVHVHSPLPS